MNSNFAHFNVRSLSKIYKTIQKTGTGILKTYAMNCVFCTVNVNSSGYVMRFYNLGTKKLDLIKLRCVVKKDSGTYMKSYSKMLRNVKTGITKLTWNTKVGETVQEHFELTGTVCSGWSTGTIYSNTLRYNFVGGKYGAIKSYDGQRHHMPSKSVSPLSPNKGPCIRMTVSDHKKTASYGGGSSAIKFREKEKKKIEDGKFLAAQQLGVKDVQSRFDSKYNSAITEMIAYTKYLGYRK